MTPSNEPEILDPSETAKTAATAAPTAGSTAPSEAKPDDALATARKEATENYERFLRISADLDNYRRRAQREKEEVRQFALSGVMQDLLPIMDNLALAVAAAQRQPDVKTLVDGVGMVLEQLKNGLSRHGLKEINPAGQAFDPNQHESIAHQPSATVAEGSVVQVVRPGFSLNGRLVRPASVIVSSGVSAPTN